MRFSTACFYLLIFLTRFLYTVVCEGIICRLNSKKNIKKGNNYICVFWVIIISWKSLNLKTQLKLDEAFSTLLNLQTRLLVIFNFNFKDNFSNTMGHFWLKNILFIWLYVPMLFISNCKLCSSGVTKILLRFCFNHWLRFDGEDSNHQRDTQQDEGGNHGDQPSEVEGDLVALGLIKQPA